MNSSRKINKTLVTLLAAGMLSIPLTIVSPSEPDAAFWMGVSKDRLIVLGFQFLLTVCLAVILLIGSRNKFSSAGFSNAARTLNNPANYVILRNLLFGTALFLSFCFVYFSVFIPQALSGLSGWLAFSAWMLFWLFIKSVPSPADYQPTKLSALFPSWKALSAAQKRTALVLLVIGLVYFCAFIPLNLTDSGSLNELSIDESVLMPHITKMLATQPNLRMAVYHFFTYGDYLYGFPFFGFSAFLLLPGRLIFGEGYADHLQLNMFLLRQFVDVLPGVLSCFLLTWLATHFKKLWTSLLLFVILLTLPEFIILNYTAWHPDEINLFFVALTLYYLDRDQLQFGSNFYFAAIACGLSIGTRSFGVFFFLAIAFLLLTGISKKVLSLRKAVLAGVLFVALMLATIIVSNPFILCPGELGATRDLFARQFDVLSTGLIGPDPENIYRTGIAAWWPFMTQNYGPGAVLGFLAVSVIAGALGSQRKHFYRILLAWLLAIGTYMIGFVLTKSPWYLLSFLVPLYCGAFAIPENITALLESWKLNSRTSGVVRIAVFVLVLGLGIYQIAENVKFILTTAINL